MGLPMCIVLILFSTSITSITSSSVTYADTYIAKFLSKEQIIWEKIEKHLNPLPDIQLIVSEDNPDVPMNYGFNLLLISSSQFAQPYYEMEYLWREIEGFFWMDKKENTTNITTDEINRRYNEVQKLNEDLFDLTSQDEFWEYGVAKMNNVFGVEYYETAHHFMSKMYNYIQLIFLRAYSLSQRYNFLGYYHFEGNYRDQGSSLKAEFLKKVSQIRKIAKISADMSIKEVFGLDKTLFHYFTRYEEITNFLQGYIVNEINLNKDGSCSNQCKDFVKTESHACNEDTGCSQSRKCSGVVRNCWELDDVQICKTNEQNKRYTQVKYSDGRIARRSSNCDSEFRLESFTKWFSKCSNCFCLCDDQLSSDRYFSLRDVVSNIDANKIVTGVRLFKHNRMIQFNIKEQELNSYGKAINEEYQYSSNENWEFKGSSFQLNDTDILEGIDYHTLTQESRSINLDTVVVPNGYAVTGVRFSLLNGHIVLQVRGTEFDYTAGQLINKDKSMWFSNPSSGAEELILGNVASPLEKGVTSVVNRAPNLFVKFGPTDYWSDISQTTVPLISSEHISVKEEGVLSGVGLYHKSAKGFGGFIAVKLVVLNIGSYIPDY